MSRERPEDRSIQSWMADLAIHAERIADGIDELNAAIRAKVATGPGGMLLRDWFAGISMAGMVSRMKMDYSTGIPDGNLSHDEVRASERGVARRAIRFADDLIAELATRKQKGGA